jgi:2-C-methyl-D-erythritol 4-phosphate cytidylyltransferase
MISALGYKVNLSKGSEHNLKINHLEDIGLFKTLKDQRATEAL